MPSPEALAPSRYRLLDSHLWVAKPDSFGLATGTGADHEFLSRTWGTPWAVAWQVFRVHWFNAPASSLSFS